MISKFKRHLLLCTLSFAVISLSACSTFGETSGDRKEVIVETWTGYTPKQEVELIENIRKNKNPDQELYEVYRDLTVIDIHSHSASNPNAVDTWGQYGIDRIVIFGNFSEPRAQITDELAWEHYHRQPSRIYPSFAGFPIYDDEGLSIVKDNLEKGYLNIGEVAAASKYSPYVANLEWKSKHPNDGNLPEIYKLAAEYRVPILLHIDPPYGTPIMHFEKAMEQNPDTIFIFGHANAYNPPENIEILLEKHPNLYIDFFAGFTAYNPDSINTLEDFVPLIEKYSDRFMISTDSGFDLTVELAAKAIYETIDLLSPETALKVAYQNYEKLVELQPPTDTQIETIKKLAERAGKYETYRLNKRMANELIFELMELTEAQP